MRTMSSSKSMTIVYAVSVLLLAANILLAPEAAFEASLTGLNIWWNYVFPVLLPYFILIEMVIESGALERISSKLHPASRRLLGIPGTGGAAVLTGWFAGYPAGAKFTSSVVKRHALDRIEGENILILSHMCNPVLVINLAAAAFLKDPAAGPYMLLVIFISFWIIALLLHQRRTELPNRSAGMTEQANEPMQPFGRLLSSSVKNAVQQLFLIGGVIIFFSVMIHAASSFPKLHTLFAGMFEIHIGLYFISHMDAAHLVKITLITSALTFGGLSVHMMTKSYMSGTGMRYRTFLFWKTLQTLIAASLSLLMWLPYQKLTAAIRPSFVSESRGHPAALEAAAHIPSFWEMPIFGFLLISCLSLFALMIIRRSAKHDPR